MAKDEVVVIDEENEKDMTIEDIDEEQLNPILPVFKNIAEDLDDEELIKIGEIVVDGYNIDEDSRTDWLDRKEKWTRLLNVTSEIEKKSFPWEGAANVIIPLITTSVYQFAARVTGAIMGTGKGLVRAVPTRETQDILQRAARVQKYMNYQLDVGDEDFKDGFEMSMAQMGLDGVAVRKCYYDPEQNEVKSQFLRAEDFSVNYGTMYLNRKTRRCTHRHIMSDMEIEGYVSEGVFLDVLSKENIDESSVDEKIDSTDNMMGIDKQNSDAGSKDSGDILERDILEQHCFLKIEDDKFKPYIVWVDKDSKKVLRIISRENYKYSGNKKVLQYFIKYNMFPTTDGSFYGPGFGAMLYRINDLANTIYNQLVDAGTLSNTTGGFIKKGAGVNSSNASFRMGQFKEIDLGYGTQRIADVIMPITFKEPSQVLMALLGSLEQYANRVTSVSEAQTGDIPRSGTGSQGVIALMEQGLKLFNEIQKRVHRSFRKELNLMYCLNGMHLDAKTYLDLQGLNNKNVPKELIMDLKTIAKEDFSSDLMILPVSDPNIMNKTERAQKAFTVYQTINQDPLTAPSIMARMTALSNYLDSLDVDEEEKQIYIKSAQEQLAFQELQRNVLENQAAMQAGMNAAAQDMTSTPQDVAASQSALGVIR